MVSLVTKISVFGALLSIAFWAAASPGDHRPHPHVIDPDTVDLGLDANVRILGVDGPETGRRASCEAERVLSARGTAYARDWLSKARSVELIAADPPRRDRYGRILGHIRVDGLDYAEVMIAAGYLRRWDYDRCGTACRPEWCLP